MTMHTNLEQLAALPQFHANYLSSCVIHMRTGCVVSMIDETEPKFTSSVNLRWPGQPNDVRCFVSIDEYFQLMQAEAKLLDL